MNKHKQLLMVWLTLAIIWVPSCFALGNRIQQQGGFASVEIKAALQYIIKFYNAHPENARLSESYGTWEKALNGFDQGWYLKVGRCITEGRGIVYPAEQFDGSVLYKFYNLQGVGTPLLVAAIMTLFGANSVFPYFLFIAVSHLLVAMGVSFLASKYTDRLSTMLMAGLLCLFCVPEIDYVFGAGLFASEPAVAPLCLAGLVVMATFRLHAERGLKRAFLFGITYGALFGVASYFRDSMSSLTTFGALAMPIISFLRKEHFKAVTMFAISALITVTAIQAPWKYYCFKQTGEYTMITLMHHGYGLWRSMWGDWKQYAQLCPNSGLGLGSYLDPAAAPEVCRTLDADKAKGEKLAVSKLIRAIWRHPLKAMEFRLPTYDRLWFGQPDCPFIYGFCLLNVLAFIGFAITRRRTFYYELYLYPIYVIGISSLLHYEHRYTQLIFSVITPITTSLFIEYIWTRWKGVKATAGNSTETEGAKAAESARDRHLTTPSGVS